MALVWVLMTSPHRGRQADKSITDLGVTMPLNQPGGGPVLLEAYEVYSALYQVPMDEPLVFAEDSVTDIPQVNGNCLRPVTPREQEMAAEFVAANKQSHSWEQKFSIAQGYRLLSQSDVAQLQTCLATHQRDAQCEPYKQIKHLRLLGVPGFDHTHKQALVSVIKSCGPGCGSGGIFAVEKANSSWRRSPATDFTRDCSWMY
jgi:hypothetical protein